jgi:hypothetical protein
VGPSRLWPGPLWRLCSARSPQPTWNVLSCASPLRVTSVAALFRVATYGLGSAWAEGPVLPANSVRSGEREGPIRGIEGYAELGARSSAEAPRSTDPAEETISIRMGIQTDYVKRIHFGRLLDTV